MKKHAIAQLKLKLNRETLRQLEEEDVKQANGGSLNPCPSSAPPFVCPIT
jgi:hypothetical protein